MNMKFRINLACFMSLLFIALFSSCNNSANEPFSEENEEGKPIIMESFDLWTAMRSYPEKEIRAMGFANAHRELRENMYRKASSREMLVTPPWQPLAPMNFAGRILSMAISPANANTIFVGSASGGLWKTTTGGTGGPGGISWTYVPTGFPVLGVGAVAINPSNANEIYIGTGEVYNKNEKGVTAGGHIRTHRGFYGIGILKSLDGGTTWSQVLSFQASNLEGVNDLLINPLKPSTVYAATTNGLYRSFNSGQNWTRIHSVLMTMDLAMKPGDTSVLYIASGNFGSTGNGLYKTINAGAATPTITRMTSGLPASFTGMARIAISAANPNRIYASIGHSSGATTKYGLYVSTNQGSSWSRPTTTNIIGNQGWYAHDLVIDPANANTVYWSEIDIYKSTNGGSSFSKRSNWSGWNLNNTTIGTTAEGTSNYVHADIHRMYITGSTLFACSDGGLFKSTNGGTSFLSLNGGLQTAQIYPNISAGNTDPNFILCGLQDNGTFVYRGTPGSARVIGADGFCTAVDPANDNISFAQFYFFNVKKSTDKGFTYPTTSYTNNYNASVVPNENACFNAPIIFARNNTNTLYGGTIFLKKSINKGTSWTSANGGVAVSGTSNPIITLAVAPTDDNTVYISTAPGGNNRSRLYKTTNGGTSVVNITGTLPDRYYSKIAVDPVDKNKVAVTLSGFGSSHVFITHDGGTTWMDIGAGLPDVPHNTLAFDPNNTSVLYVGNDLGVYYATDVPAAATGATSATLNWTSYNEGFTDATLVSDLLVTSNNKLRMATHGRGLWDRDLAVVETAAVQLSEVKAVPLDDKNLISWKARHESGVDYYELEFSNDGTSFTPAGKLTPINKATGNPNQYQLTDVNNLAANGYYRIKINAANKPPLYSGIMEVARKMKTGFKIYPNPVREKLQFDIVSKEQGEAQIRIVDITGKVMITRSEKLTKGVNRITIPVQQLVPGNYRLVTTGAAQANTSFIRMQ
jgi:Secretion system C-terminal sorting domain